MSKHFGLLPERGPVSASCINEWTHNAEVCARRAREYVEELGRPGNSATTIQLQDVSALYYKLAREARGIY